MPNVTPTKTTTAVNAEEKVIMPEQNSGDKKLIATDTNEVVTAETLIEALKQMEKHGQLAVGVRIHVQVTDDGTVSLEVLEDGKLKKLTASAKGLFNRNKKLVLTGAALLAVSVLVKVVANRQEALDAEPTDEDLADAAEADATA